MKAVLAFAVIGLAGCVTVPPPNAGPSAGLGQIALVSGIKVRPISVVEDSRCPALVRCVWEGRLIVRARMTGPGWTQIRDFELGVPQAVDQYRVALISAEPQKAAPGEIDPRAYRFTFSAIGR